MKPIHTFWTLAYEHGRWGNSKYEPKLLDTVKKILSN
jgi:hypothetical protein